MSAPTPAPSLREALEAMMLALASAREMLGVFEDHGGHDGLSGKGYQATLDQMDDARKLANLALAQPAPAALPDDLRADGWMVAVHNDYRLNGEQHTFWLFTKDGRAVKGEGRTDADALTAVRAALIKATEATHG